MGKIWAIARTLIAESLHQKLAIVFIIVLAVVLVGLPFMMQGDGTLSGRVQTFLSYALSALSGIICILTIFIACYSLSSEVTEKHAFLTATKPIDRSQIIFGKWVGIAVFDAVLVIVGGGMIFGIVMLLARMQPVNEQDRTRLHDEVLACRTGRQLPIPTEALAAQVQSYIDRLREEGRADIDNPATEQNLRKQRAAELMRDYRTVAPLESRSWEFQDLRTPRDPNSLLYLRYKFDLTSEPLLTEMRFFWIFGDRGKGATQYVRAVEDPQEQVRTIDVPADAVGNDGSLLVTIVNQDPENPEMSWPTRIVFEESGDLEVLYVIGSFPGNLARALTLIYWRALFLAAVGLFAASFLGFPIAALVSFTTYFSSAVANFIQESIDVLRPVELRDPTEYLAYGLKPIVSAFLWLVPKFSVYDGVPTLVDGRNVTLMWVLQGFAELVVVRAMLVCIIAWLIFRRRELAQVIV